MLTKLFRNWWLLAVRGVIAIAFGILALIWPEPTKVALVLLFGWFALVDGIFTVAAGITWHEHFERWWAVLLEGLTGIIIGSVTLFWPNITGLVLVYFIAAWAIVTGIFEIVAAFTFRRVISGEWAMILNGLLSVALGILMFVYPAVGAVGLVWMIAVYAIFAGAMELILAFRLRGLVRKLRSIIPSAA